MNMPHAAAHHRPVVIVFALLAMYAGVSTFLTMSRREDPEITIRNAIVETRWPGAAAQKVEELVTDPLEDVIYGMEDVDTITSTSRVGYSRIDIELGDWISESEVDQVWDELRSKIQPVTAQLPQGCGQPFVNSDFGDVSAVVLALYPRPGSHGEEEPYTYRELEIFAEDLEDVLKEIESVGRVDIYGAPKEVITLAVDPSDWANMDLTQDQLARALDGRNLATGGVQVTTAEGTFPLDPTGELLSVDDIRNVVVDVRPDGLPVKVGDLPFEIDRGAADPRVVGIRFTSEEGTAERALLVGVTMKTGRNVVAMGEAVDAAAQRFQAERLPPDVAITRINDLPKQVDDLISGFVTNLWQAIVIVLGVALLMMGWRPAVVMAAAVPLCMITAIAVVKSFGVELEQFSIASLIIALGMIVDNAIVVSDNAQRLIDEGKDRLEAVIEGGQGLAIPILTSTLTTVSAFGPMLAIPGGSGEYMRSLPVVVSTTLLISYLVAMTVTPVMCFYVLRPRKVKDGASQADSAKGPIAAAVRWCVEHKLLTLGGASAALVGALMLVPMIGNQFFPGGQRDQLFLHVNLPEGASLEATEEVVARVEKVLVEHSKTEDGTERLANATSFVGFGGPRLMLTMSPEAAISNYAMVLVNTTDPVLSRPWCDELRAALGDIPGARIEVQPFQLGPPISNPIEYRLVGPELSVLREAAEEMVGVFRATTGTLEPSHDWGNAGYQVELRVDADRASLAGVSSAAVAASLRDLYTGGHLTTYREGDHQVDVVLRMGKDQRSTLASMETMYVEGGQGKVPLASVASTVTGWQPALICRRNKLRTVSVGSSVLPGFLANTVSAEIRGGLEEILDGLPPGYRLEVGGEAEETAKSQENITGAMKVSMILIVLVLLVQYSSLVKPFIVLAAVPLALIGALVGLFVSGWPLGFMPSLGVVSLAGIVINNSIILIDCVETSVREGMPLREAVASAGQARIGPIMLTTLTTIGGLLPLALFGGPMWAGMSWAMIGGLTLSTGLTVLVVPTIYVLCAERFGMRVV